MPTPADARLRPGGDGAPAACRTCTRAWRRYRHGRCDACYMYWWRHGVERPAHRWCHIRPCVNCGVADDHLVLDRCHTCYAYHHRYGRDRSQALMERHWARTA